MRDMVSLSAHHRKQVSYVPMSEEHLEHKELPLHPPESCPWNNGESNTWNASIQVVKVETKHN